MTDDSITQFAGFGIACRIAEELTANRPVVALESALITHGLSSPQNYDVARRLEQIVSERGVAPATIGVLAGKIKVGLSNDELRSLAQAQNVHKVSVRELSTAIARDWHGGTTVAATAWAAYRAGIDVFATGGIGGVHLGEAMDVSADLPVLAETPIVVVSAGAKAILNLPRTVEWLETHGVPIVGYDTDEFPAFYSRDSGLALSTQADTPRDAAAILRAGRQLGLCQALLVVASVPADAEIPREYIDEMSAQAHREAESQGITGRDLTPFLLARLDELTDGASTRANIALLENNARIAADIAKAVVGDE